MTHITATLRDSTTIRLDFDFDTAVNAKIKTIDGYAFIAAGAFWTVPVKRLDALVKAFGAALYIDGAVIDAKMDNDLARVRIFVDNLLAAGISLDVVNGRVMGSGGAYCADPWQREIDARAAKIIALGLQHSHARARVHAPASAPAYTHAPAWLENSGQPDDVDGDLVQFTTNEITSDSRGVSAVSAETLRQAELLVNGMRNAAKNQYNEEAMRQSRQRRRYAKVK